MAGAYSPSRKKALIGVLVLCFMGQTALVYSDQREAPLSEEAIRGRKLFHVHACQVCHQLYGQGGFLGPDLTNAWSRVDQARLTSLLTVGSGQMPGLGLSAGEIADLGTFLREIDRPELGWGQLRLGSGDTGPQARFEGAVERMLPRNSPEREGYAAVSARACSQCHYPLQVSVVGAPDFSEIAGHLSLDEIRTVLIEGRPENGMPPPGPPLTSTEVEAVLDYLVWLHQNRVTLSREFAGSGGGRFAWSALPWWEF